MTNIEAQAYAVVALNRLVRQGLVKSEEKDVYSIMDRMMSDMMDIMSASEAEIKAEKILREGK